MDTRYYQKKVKVAWLGVSELISMNSSKFKFHDELNNLIFQNSIEKFNTNWFNLHHPYIKLNINNKRSNKRRKLKDPSNNSDDIDDKLNTLIIEGLKSLQPLSLTGVQYLDQQPLNKFNHQANNGINFTQFDDLIKLIYKFNDESDIDRIELSDEEINILDIEHLFHHLISNSTEKACKLTITNYTQTYSIPPNSKFIMSDLESLNDLLVYKQLESSTYDLILMDPPWFNHSIKRGNHYKGQDKYTLLNIEIPRLLHSSGILAIWITNQPSILKFVTLKLFPKWKLKLVGTWYWVKITTQGDLVIPLDGERERKPYEVLLLATFESNQQLTEIPSNFIYSVPFQYHSRKPNLFPYLSELIDYKVGKDVSKLELFGRYLTKGCTTWGNEVLKFQESYFLD